MQALDIHLAIRIHEPSVEASWIGVDPLRNEKLNTGLIVLVASHYHLSHPSTVIGLNAKRHHLECNPAALSKEYIKPDIFFRKDEISNK